MSRRLAAAIAAVLAVLLVGCQATGMDSSSAAPASPSTAASTSTNEAAPATPTKTTIENLHNVQELTNAGFAAPASYSGEGVLRAGMVPHHLIAADMIAGFWKLAGEQHKEKPYDAVLIVSPSHFPENCDSDVVTTTANWSTHLGSITTDQQLVEAILADELVAAEDNARGVELDHGVGGLTPFVRRYLPDVPLAVCMLSNKLPNDRLRAFQDIVAAEMQGRNILVVASADCSHYLMPDDAAERDVQTTLAIMARDRTLLLTFSDKNIDSPQSVTTMLRVADEVEGTLVRLGHSASNEKLPHALSNQVYSEGITTYMVFGVFGV